jgi:hypothetical protein
VSTDNGFLVQYSPLAAQLLNFMPPTSTTTSTTVTHTHSESRLQRTTRIRLCGSFGRTSRPLSGHTVALFCVLSRIPASPLAAGLLMMLLCATCRSGPQRQLRCMREACFILASRRFPSMNAPLVAPVVSADALRMFVGHLLRSLSSADSSQPLLAVCLMSSSTPSYVTDPDSVMTKVLAFLGGDLTSPTHEVLLDLADIFGGGIAEHVTETRRWPASGEPPPHGCDANVFAQAASAGARGFFCKLPDQSAKALSAAYCTANYFLKPTKWANVTVGSASISPVGVVHRMPLLPGSDRSGLTDYTTQQMNALMKRTRGFSRVTALQTLDRRLLRCRSQRVVLDVGPQPKLSWLD